MSGKKGVASTDLKFMNYAVYVSRAMSQMGYVPTSDITKASLLIILNYGIGDPKKTYFTYTSPVFGQTGGQTYNYTANTYGTSGYQRTSGTVTEQKGFGVVGYQSNLGSRTYYDRFIDFLAIDAKTFLKTNQVVELCRTTIKSSGSSGHLSNVFPYMVAAARRHLCTNTGRVVTRVLKEDSISVKQIKGIKVEQ